MLHFLRWQQIIEVVREAENWHGNGTFLGMIIVVDMVMLIFTGGAIDLLDNIRYHCQPLNLQTKTRRYVSQLPWRIPLLGVIIWSIVQDETETPILDWLASEWALPILIVVGIAEILIYLIVAGRCVQLLETKWQ
jgi:hypothetical protein